MKELKIKINGMVCGGCENRVKTALSEISGVESVDADHNTGIVTIKSEKDLEIAQLNLKIKSYEMQIKMINSFVNQVKIIVG